MTDRMSWAVSMIDGLGIDVARDEPADAPISTRLRFNTGYDVTIIGRLLSAIIDTITVGVVFLLARELTDDRKVGLLAALLQSLTVLHIQYSHFLGERAVGCVLRDMRRLGKRATCPWPGQLANARLHLGRGWSGHCIEAEWHRECGRPIRCCSDRDWARHRPPPATADRSGRGCASRAQY